MTRWVRTSRQVSATMGDEAVILSFEDGMYYSLNPAGSVLWERLEHPATLDELEAEIRERFSNVPDDCASDIQAILAEMAERRLVAEAA